MTRVYNRRHRTADEQLVQTMPIVEVGQVDPMTVARKRAALPPCLFLAPDARHACTRAAGHDDAGRRSDHAPRLHVAADRAGVALLTWDIPT